jgi:hypothetical protein
MSAPKTSMTNLSDPVTIDDTKLFFTLFLGSPQNKNRLDEQDRLSVIHKISQKFNLFTLVDGKGMWNGQFEDTLIIHIATNDIPSVAELAHTLRASFDQDGVSIQCGHHMIRATRDNRVKDTITTLTQLSKPPLS